MACTPSCNHPKPSAPRPAAPSNLPNGISIRTADQAARAREREAMCAVCPFARSCPMGGDGPDARKARQDPEERCWAGRWPDARGRVRTGAFATLGVPKAVRLRLGLAAAWRVLRRHLQDGGQYPGCGCFVGLLVARERAGRFIRRARRRIWRAWRRRAHRSWLW